MIKTLRSGSVGIGLNSLKPLNTVKTGLILNLDAKNPVSYPGTGTTWYDLSGNGYNATLVNSPTYNSNGYFDFTRTSTQYAYTSNNLMSKIGTGNVAYTIEVIFQLKSTPGAIGTGAYSLAGHASANGIGAQAISGIYGNFGYRSTSNFNTTSLLSLSTWYHMIFTREPGVLNRIYINGTLDSSNTIANLTVNDPGTAEFQIANASTRVGTLDGYMSYVSVYNTYFTDTMVKQNYNALKARYQV